MNLTPEQEQILERFERTAIAWRRITPRLLKRYRADEVPKAQFKGGLWGVSFGDMANLPTRCAALHAKLVQDVEALHEEGAAEFGIPKRRARRIVYVTPLERRSINNSVYYCCFMGISKRD